MTDGLGSDSVLRGLDDALDDLEALYKDIHSHPELSLQEKRTAGLAADRLKTAASPGRDRDARSPDGLRAFRRP
jgi:metal-dependent amidase/aminoacylase/carboxypeptidase family protein